MVLFPRCAPRERVGLSIVYFQLPGVDCILVSEAREYDSFEYVRDTIYSGAKKGEILIPHVSGEDEGLHYFAEWVKPFVPEVPAQYIPTSDEYWTVSFSRTSRSLYSGGIMPSLDPRSEKS
jgi:hypothetical protein